MFLNRKNPLKICLASCDKDRRKTACHLKYSKVYLTVFQDWLECIWEFLITVSFPAALVSVTQTLLLLLSTLVILFGVQLWVHLETCLYSASLPLRRNHVNSWFQTTSCIHSNLQVLSSSLYLSFLSLFSIFFLLPRTELMISSRKQKVLPIFSLFPHPLDNPRLKTLQGFSFPSHLLATCCLSLSCNIYFSKMSPWFLPLVQNPAAAYVVIVWHVLYCFLSGHSNSLRSPSD